MEIPWLRTAPISYGQGLPHILAKQRRLPHIALLILAAPLSPLRRPESNLLLHDRLRREDRRAIPARKRLERLLCLPLVLASGMVPEQVIRKLPAARLGNLEELVPVHGTGDPDIIEGRTTIDPIHGAGHIGVLEKALVDELEDVFHAEGDVVDEEDGRVGGEIFGRGREWVEGLVAENGERFNTIDAIARFGVDVVGGEIVGYVQGGKFRGERV